MLTLITNGKILTSQGWIEKGWLLFENSQIISLGQGATDVVADKIIDAKGATYYAIALTVNHICSTVFRGIDTALSVSTMMNGEYGISDVCLSILSVVGRGGVSGKLIAPLTDEEIAKLHYIADKLKEIINQLKI